MIVQEEKQKIGYNKQATKTVSIAFYTKKNKSQNRKEEIIVKTKKEKNISVRQTRN